MLLTGLLCSTLHSAAQNRKESFCSACSVHVITSCAQPLQKKIQDAISAFMQSEKWCRLLKCYKDKNSFPGSFYPHRACHVTICLFWINHRQKSTLNKRVDQVTSCMLPLGRLVEYFMIKQAIILHRSRPWLRLKWGRGAQITVQTPSQQHKGTAPVRGGSRRGKAIWVNPH